MPQSDLSSLWDALTAARQFSDQSIRCAPSCVLLSDLLHKSSLSVPLEQLSNSTVLIATKGQFATALALIELDGIARRIVLYPGDLPRAHIPSVVARCFSALEYFLRYSPIWGFADFFTRTSSRRIANAGQIRGVDGRLSDQSWR
jgi:hypothetical protein